MPGIEITQEQRKALKRYAKGHLNHLHPYSKADIMEKLLKATGGDTSRAQTGFYMLVKSKIISTSNGQTYYHNYD